MPGKVNPVMSEMVLQVAAQVIGNDATIALAGSGLGSTFELNVMMPVMAYNLLQSIELLSPGRPGLRRPLRRRASRPTASAARGWSSRAWRCVPASPR